MTHGERRTKKRVWCGEKEEEEKKKKRREVMNDDGVGRREEKRKERNPFYLSLCYFDVIFELKLNCQLGIKCYKN
jgi:hypothetical protein